MCGVTKTHDDGNDAATPPDLPELAKYPQHVRDALASLWEVQQRVEGATQVRDATLAERGSRLRDFWPMLDEYGIGPAVIARATGIGRSNVRFILGGR